MFPNHTNIWESHTGLYCRDNPLPQREIKHSELSWLHFRRFEEEQREKLAQIRTQAQEDKKKMIK